MAKGYDVVDDITMGVMTFTNKKEALECFKHIEKGFIAKWDDDEEINEIIKVKE